MKLFNTLCLEITSRCNRSCVFCPVAYNERPDESMKKKLIVKALRELGEMEYSGRIEFCVYNEPMMNLTLLHLCLKWARRMVPKSCLMIATNGDYIHSVSDIDDLYAFGLNQLLINCYSPGLFSKRQEWIDHLPLEVSRTKSVYAVLSSRSKVVQIQDKSDPDQFGKGVFSLANRAGNISEFLLPLERPLQRMCVKPFRIFNINWLGEALVCCQDYHGSMSFGSLKDSTLEELWNHPFMNRYRHQLLKKDRTLPLCNRCDCSAGAYPHNVPTPGASMSSLRQIYAIREASGRPV